MKRASPFLKYDESLASRPRSIFFRVPSLRNLISAELSRGCRFVSKASLDAANSADFRESRDIRAPVHKRVAYVFL